MPSTGYPNPKVNTAIYDTPVTASFTPRDWLDLALAALDQACVRSAALNRAYKAVEDVIAEETPEDESAAGTVADKLNALAKKLDHADLDSTLDVAVLSDLCNDARGALKALVAVLPERSDHGLLAASQAAILGATVQHTAAKIRGWAATWRAVAAAEETPKHDPDVAVLAL